MRAEIAVLVVDGEPLSRETSMRQLREAGYRCAAVGDPNQALSLLAEEKWDVVLCDLRMPGMDGVDLLRVIRRDHSGVDVILTTAFATVETAVAALHEGAADYLPRPFHFRELDHRLRKLAELRSYRSELRALRARHASCSDSCGIVGESEATRAVVARIGVLAAQSEPVLVTGEAGTGKHLVARALHMRSPRSSQPFVHVPCAAVPAELATAELFGRGAVGEGAGATEARASAFERAHGGTLLLDDVEALPLETQTELLRVMRESAAPETGGSRAPSATVRVIASSRRDLDDAVAAGRFHRDLLTRLRELEIHLQPLRARREDIIELVDHFLCELAERTGRPVISLSPRAAELLQRHSWPGNVRELRNTLEAMVISCPGGVAEIEHLPAHVRGENGDAEELFTLHLDGRDKVPFSQVVCRVEAELLGWALDQAGGQQRRAAELLGLPRTTFQSKLRQRLAGS